MSSTLPSDYVPNRVRSFIDTLIYAKDEYKDVQAMMLAGPNHAREAFTSVPLGFASASDPETGKTTLAARIPLLLGHNSWKVTRQTTPDSIRSKFLERDRPNLVVDDVGKIFGDAGMNNKQNQLYGVLIDCYCEDGTATMSINRVATDVCTYNQAWMNGLRRAIPDDLFSRCIHFKMEAAPSGYPLRDAMDESVRADARILNEALHAWAGSHREEMRQFMRGPVRFIHPKLEGRKRQLWGPVFAAAYSAGGDWPRRIYDAFVLVALDASEKPVLVPEQRCLLTTADLIMRRDLGNTLFAADLLAMLRELPDSDYYRTADDTHLLRNIFPDALGGLHTVTGTALTGEHAGQKGRAKGWSTPAILKAAADLHDMLYPPMLPMEDETADFLAFEPTVTSVNTTTGRRKK